MLVFCLIVDKQEEFRSLIVLPKLLPPAGAAVR